MAKDYTSTGLIEKLTALVGKHGSSNARIAEELNRARIKTPTGKEWTALNVRIFVGRHIKKQAAQPTQKKGAAPRPATRPKEVRQDRVVTVSPDISKLLEEMYRDRTLQGLAALYRSGELTAPVESRKSGKGLPGPAQGTRPVFKGERRNVGVLINKEILKRALGKAKLEKTRTGGSLSMLVELLLWRYLESPNDVIDIRRGRK